jgi:diaminohydroxyphosphoribosylaminopyrimidine deaminase / 5-amino-6-(5-phosphoribosylamino)uracil reductase
MWSSLLKNEPAARSETGNVHDDILYMKMAIDLAWDGIGRTAPNPMVGCVIVKDGEVVGKGTHFYEKIDHAEVVALKEAGDKARGATVYVTLEPCSHQGRTPPCADALIKAGVARMVYGLKDPNPAVNGEGHAKLEEAGIKVEAGLLADEIREQNKFFVTAQEKSRPYVLLKWAMTSDGKIATRTGVSRWISSDASRNVVHHLRNIYDAVLIGHATALADNPSLTCRVDLSIPLPSELFPKSPTDIRNPQRIVLDTFGATCDTDQAFFHEPGKTMLVVGPESPWDVCEMRDSIDSSKIEAIECPLEHGRIDLGYLLGELKKRNVYSLLVEGGSGVHESFLKAGLVDEVAIAVAPKIFGGESSPGPVGGGGIENVADAWRIEHIKYFRICDDMWINGKIALS